MDLKTQRELVSQVTTPGGDNTFLTAESAAAQQRRTVRNAVFFVVLVIVAIELLARRGPSSKQTDGSSTQNYGNVISFDSHHVSIDSDFPFHMLVVKSWSAFLQDQAARYQISQKAKGTPKPTPNAGDSSQHLMAIQQQPALDSDPKTGMLKLADTIVLNLALQTDVRSLAFAAKAAGVPMVGIAPRSVFQKAKAGSQFATSLGWLFAKGQTTERPERMHRMNLELRGGRIELLFVTRSLRRGVELDEGQEDFLDRVYDERTFAQVVFLLTVRLPPTSVTAVDGKAEQQDPHFAPLPNALRYKHTDELRFATVIEVQIDWDGQHPTESFKQSAFRDPLLHMLMHAKDKGGTAADEGDEKAVQTSRRPGFVHPWHRQFASSKSAKRKPTTTLETHGNIRLPVALTVAPLVSVSSISDGKDNVEERWDMHFVTSDGGAHVPLVNVTLQDVGVNL